MHSIDLAFLVQGREVVWPCLAERQRLCCLGDHQAAHPTPAVLFGIDDPPSRSYAAAIFVLAPLINDRGELFPVGLANDLEPFSMAVLENRDFGAYNTERIGVAFQGVVVFNTWRSIVGPIIPSASGNGAEAANSRHRNHLPLLRVVLVEYKAVDLAFQRIESGMLCYMDEVAEFIRGRLLRDRAP